ncbi:hypothetical protein SAMN05660649_00691 [Desulfotomaculum arcticum]|uniref:CcmD family protein n=1 Tax=Desulfotruncus arcticus DSM 17038 TaxID=1121424 RepID=A0A1I2P987_9FIRM|nr:hypothetical protein SAMN05660649_00691 [Desulfotomaculum arcticum] [Desulfotruncus arcticus DSM 17038]
MDFYIIAGAAALTVVFFYIYIRIVRHKIKDQDKRQINKRQ